MEEYYKRSSDYLIDYIGWFKTDLTQIKYVNNINNKFPLVKIPINS